jgi:hypothetical protein
MNADASGLFHFSRDRLAVLGGTPHDSASAPMLAHPEVTSGLLADRGSLAGLDPVARNRRSASGPLSRSRRELPRRLSTIFVTASAYQAGIVARQIRASQRCVARLGGQAWPQSRCVLLMQEPIRNCWRR